jgi:hypothetical protein
MNRSTTVAIMATILCAGTVSWAQQPPQPQPPVPAQQDQNAEQAKAAAAQRYFGAKAAQAQVQAAQAQAQAQAAKAAAQAAPYDAMHRAFYDKLRPTQVKMEKLPYCGIATVEVPPALTDQLKLTKGMGLLVDFVEPASPAETAGVKQHDILLKFNDQLLTNPEQLRALVRMKMLSDDVKLSIIRQGQPTSVNIELGEKEMPVEPEANAAPPTGQNKPYGFKPNGQLVMDDQMLRAAGGNGGAWGGGFGGGGGGGGFAYTNVNGQNQMVWKDPQSTLNLELKDGKAVKLVAKDRGGKEIFNGPVETDEQRKALSADLADKLQKAENGGPMQYRRAAMMALGGGGGGGGGGRARVLTSTDNDTLILARFENRKATHALAFSTDDGKVLFDGPTASDEQRKAIPEAVAKQLEVLEKNQDAGAEFGVIGRN